MTLAVKVSAPLEETLKDEIEKLVSDNVASRLFAKDFTLWGKEAEAESSIRLGWVDAATASLDMIPRLRTIREQLLSRGLTRVVLCGMGGSSLAPEVIAATDGVELVVLDSTDPSQVSDAVSKDISKTVVVVSSKSGSTVETDSQKRIFEKAFEDSGIDKTERIFIVTDPGSAMQTKAEADGYQVFLADPTVGGRYSALTAFGVVPSMLAGVEMEPILQNAQAAAVVLRNDSIENPGLRLGAVMARTLGKFGFRDKLGLVSDGTGIVGFGDWLEQLIAESTGKIDRGVLPVPLEPDSPEVLLKPEDMVLIGLSDDANDSRFEVAVSGSLGEQMMLWEVATAVCSRLLGINPFDQPDVESAKIAARALLESPAASSAYLFEQGGIQVAASNLSVDSSGSIAQAIEELLAKAGEDSYFSIQVYLNRLKFPEAHALRELMAAKTSRPVTFGWGPRFLHSTGQYHKGGPKQGIFLQLTSAEEADLAVPGREFSFGELIASQADGDARVLAQTGRPVLSLRPQDPAAGIKLIGGLLS